MESKKISLSRLKKIMSQEEMKKITGGCCPHGGTCRYSDGKEGVSCNNDHDCELYGGSGSSCFCFGTW